MVRRTVLQRGFAALFLVLLLVGSWPAPAAGTETAAAPARWIVGLDPFPHHLQRGDTWNGGTVARSDPVLGFLVVLADAAFPERTRGRDDVRYLERDRPMALTFVPNDPRWSDQYGPEQVRADLAWDITRGTTEKTLCVVDTGLRTTHQDLAGSRWLGGRDIADGDDNVADPHGHGTHVTGIAVATTHNGKGIAGIAQVPFRVAKVMESGSGNIWQSDTASGIRWCTDNDGDVINISLGSAQTTTALTNAIAYAHGNGVLILAATGNDHCSDCVLYPARYSEVVAVGCTDANGIRCPFSNGGAQVELAAPGDLILSTCRGSDTSYCTMSGTSMASPTAAGVAALVWSYAKERSRDEIRTILQDTATDRGADGRDTLYGFGIPDADKALARAKPIAPTARFTASCVAATCTFDGRGSTDTDGTLAGWSWDLGDGSTSTAASLRHAYGASGTYAVRLTVTDNHGFTDSAYDNVTVTVPPPVRPPPFAPPADPHVVDTQEDLVGDQLPLAHMDVESAWFEDDIARLYVGMKVANMVGAEQTNSFVAYRVAFTPAWEMTDPTLDGTVPAGSVPIRFELRAVHSPIGLPVYARTTFELWVETQDERTMQTTWREVTQLDGHLSTGTDIIWWPVARADLGAPTTATLTAPSAIASPMVRGVLSTYGVTGDATGTGRDHTF